MKRKIFYITLLIILLFGVTNVYADYSSVTATAKVIETGEIYEESVLEYTIKEQEVKIEVIDGDYKGQTIYTKFSISYDMDGKIEGYPLDIGNKVSVQLNIVDGVVVTASIQDVVRQDYIIWIVALFFILILIVGKITGLKSIISLILTILGIFCIMLPAIINGFNAVLASILVSILIIIVSFTIISGFSKKSVIAMIGTTGGVVFSGIIALIFGSLAKLSGGQEAALYLSMNSRNLVFNYRELLFAGIVIASLGACMDVGMSISSALEELKQKNPNITGKELFKSGMNIGKDMIGTMTNTLILAYVGESIILVLLYMVNQLSLSEIINIEKIATDTISAISASMGVIFTVPITTFTCKLLNSKTKSSINNSTKDTSSNVDFDAKINTTANNK